MQQEIQPRLVLAFIFNLLFRDVDNDLSLGSSAHLILNRLKRFFKWKHLVNDWFHFTLLQKFGDYLNKFSICFAKHAMFGTRKSAIVQRSLLALSLRMSFPISTSFVVSTTTSAQPFNFSPAFFLVDASHTRTSPKFLNHHHVDHAITEYLQVAVILLKLKIQLSLSQIKRLV